MSLRRLNRKVKTLANKGKPGIPNRRMTTRIDSNGDLREYHPTKGYKRKVETGN